MCNGTQRRTDGKAKGPLPNCLGFLWPQTGVTAPDQDEGCHPNQQGLEKSIIKKGHEKRQPRNDSGGIIIAPGGCYCSEKDINMQPVVQELATLHSCGRQEKTTERNLRYIWNKEGQCDTREWLIWRGRGDKTLDVLEGGRKERGWASLCSVQSDWGRAMGRTGKSFYFVRFWLHLQGCVSK